MLLAAVAAGAGAGLCIARLCRAWSDAEAEEQRQRFHALYADPATDLDDLPMELPQCDTVGCRGVFAGRHAGRNSLHDRQLTPACSAVMLVDGDGHGFRLSNVHVLAGMVSADRA